MAVKGRGSGRRRELAELAREATLALEAVLVDATAAVRSRVSRDGRVSNRLVDREQRATHGLAWLATYVEAARQLAAYAERLQASGRLNEIEELVARIAIGEYLAQVLGGIPISQGEIVRPADLGLSSVPVAARMTAGVEVLIASGNNADNRARLVALLRAQHSAAIDNGLDDTL
jgi:(2S)-methylsuccinyl-CoA dehydrogenase